jgi:hypothetical protein
VQRRLQIQKQFSNKLQEFPLEKKIGSEIELPYIKSFTNRIEDCSNITNMKALAKFKNKDVILEDKSYNSNKLILNDKDSANKNYVAFGQSERSPALNFNKDSTLLEKTSKILNKNKRKKNANFGYIFILKKKFCFTSKFIKEEEKSKVYDFASEYLDSRSDILYYLKTLERIDQIRHVLFNFQQNYAFDFMKKPNLYRKEDYEEYHLNFNMMDCDKLYDMIHYFRNIINNKENVHQYDPKLLEILSPEILSLIIEAEGNTK